MKCRNADGDDRRIIPEELNATAGIDIDSHRCDPQKYRSEDQSKEEALADAGILFRAIVKACDRLEALADAEDSAEDEHADPVYYAHCGYGSVAIDTCRIVKDHR